MKINVGILYSGFANVEDRAFFYEQQDEAKISHQLDGKRWESATIELPDGFTVEETVAGTAVLDPQGRPVEVYAKVNDIYTATVTIAVIDISTSTFWRKKYKVDLLL